jgi:hypothetical protein
MLMVFIDYYIMKPNGKGSSILWRIFAVVFAILNLFLGI